mmetsp:Transcript_74494/g.230212  ORF Transcript_74494/g.230212 Transcript_74494/m.230212 type:complete len:280 (-) Transcript_74494:2112-2951(-)
MVRIWDVELPDVRRGTEVHDPAESHLDLADESVTVDQDLPIDELLVVGVARLALHELRFSRLHRVGDRSPDVSADVDKKHLLDRQRQREACDFDKRWRHLWYLGAERVHDGLLQVLAGQATLLDAVDNGGKVVVLQDDVRRVLGHLGAADAHRHAHLCLLQSGCVVDAVAGHGADVAEAVIAVLLVGLHDDLLVDRRDPREDASLLGGLLPPLDVVRRLLVGEVVALWQPALELHPRDDGEVLPAALSLVLLRQDIDALGDGSGCLGVVAGDHHDLNSC